MEFEEVLAHYGVKGMKWGVRKDKKGTSDGPESEDFTKTRATATKIKAGGTKAVSNEELKALVERMRLEQQYSQLNPKSNTIREGRKFAKEVLNVANTANQVINFVNSPAGKLIKESMAQAAVGSSSSPRKDRRARGGGL